MDCVTCPVESECRYPNKPCEFVSQRKFWILTDVQNSTQRKQCGRENKAGSYTSKGNWCMENKDTTNTTVNSEEFKGKIIITTKCNDCGGAIDILIWDDFFGETSCECGKIINAVIVIQY